MLNRDASRQESVGVGETNLPNPPTLSPRGRGFRVAAITLGLTLLASMAAAKEMLVCGFGNNAVYRYDMSGNLLGTLDAAGNLSGPLCAKMGPDGKIYVTSEGNNRIVRFSASSGALVDTFISDAGLDSPTGLAWDKSGNLYVSSFNGNKVRKYNGATGAYLSDFVTAGSGLLSGADNGMTFGPDGNLYVPSYNNNRIIKYNGTTGALIGNFIPSIGRPRVFEWVGASVYVTSETQNAVKKYNGTNGVAQGNLVAPGAGGLRTPIGMVFDGDGFIYVTSATNQVLKYDAATGAFVGVFVDTLPTGLFQPAFLTIIPGPGGWVLMALGMGAMRRRR